MVGKMKSLENSSLTGSNNISPLLQLVVKESGTLSVHMINPLPNDKFSDCSKLKAFADDNLNLAKKLKFVIGRVENIVGKGENAGNQHFLLFPQCFQKASILGSVKVGIVC